MGLLWADLRMLANLPVTPVGRRVAFGTLLGLLLLALMSWWIAGEVVVRPRLIAFARGGDPADSLRAMLGAGLMPCPVAATWLGLALAQRQLFETTELGLWRVAPLPRWRPAVQILLRATFVASCWATALSAPFVVTMLRHAGAPWLAYALLPVALVVASAPLLCLLLSAQIVLVRFCSGRWLRLVLALAAAAASVGFSTWLLLGLFQSPEARRTAIAATDPDTLPWTIDTGAALLAAATRGELAVAPLLGGLGWLAAAAVIFVAVAWLHPGAVERHQRANQLLWRGSRSRWHGSVARIVRKKEIAQVLQQPGALLGFFVFGFLVFALAKQRVLTAKILGDLDLPPQVAQFGAMLALWFVAVLLVLYAHMGRLALWDGAQWSLYMSSPTRPSSILRGKLTAVGVFLMWPLLLVAAAGAQQFGADRLVLWHFLAMALCGTAMALGVVAAIGTWPRLMQPDDGGQIVQSGRNFVAAMALVLCFELTLSPALIGWIALMDRADRQPLSLTQATAAAPTVLAIAATYGALVLGIGYAIGCRNYRRLLSPRR
ncbi:MAG: hypothetical protein KDC48_08235 [Planctomycetes bacterium]|nr:hypothetical protein [Planctomycetota bacterium]